MNQNLLRMRIWASALLGSLFALNLAWSVTLTIPEPSGAPGDMVTVPILVDTARGIAGIGCVLVYDPALLVDPGAQITALTQGFEIEQSVGEGKIAIALANSRGIPEGSGSLVDVRFIVASDAERGATGPLTLKNVSLVDENTEEIPCSAKSGRFTVRLTGVPLIISTPVTTQAEGRNLTVSASVTDVGEVQSVVLYYRAGGEQAFSSLTTSKGSGQPYEATIPGSAVTYSGLEYYLSASNAQGGVATIPENGKNRPYCVQVTFQDCIAEEAYPTRIWKMVGVSVMPDNGSPSEILTALGGYDIAKWRLFRFYEKAYHEYLREEIGKFEPGKAFWLHTRIPEFKFRTGSGRTTRTDASFEITLETGWNDISCPFAFPVRWDDVMVESGDPAGVAGPYTYDGAAWSFPVPTDRLVPWEGYAVKNSNPDPVTIKVPSISAEGSTKPLAKPLTDGEWVLRVQVHAPDFGFRISDFGLSIPQSAFRNPQWKGDMNNFLGFREDARIEWDRWDLPEPPPAPGDYVRLYFPHGDWGVYPDVYTSDFRPPLRLRPSLRSRASSGHGSEGEVWTFVVEGSLEGSEALLSFEGVSDLPGDLKASLLDVDGRISLDLREEMTYPITVGRDQRHFQIVVGSADYVEETTGDFRALPEGYELSQNRPNPFNVKTVIAYQISERGQVRLTVYDLLGRKVAVLVDGTRDPGYFSAVWNGRNENGNRVASGVYFCVLETQRKRIVRKMVAVR